MMAELTEDQKLETVECPTYGRVRFNGDKLQQRVHIYVCRKYGGRLVSQKHEWRDVPTVEEE